MAQIEASSAASVATLRTAGEDAGSRRVVEGNIVASGQFSEGSAIVAGLQPQVLGAA
jgi:hypothetical protein